MKYILFFISIIAFSSCSKKSEIEKKPIRLLEVSVSFMDVIPGEKIMLTEGLDTLIVEAKDGENIIEFQSSQIPSIIQISTINLEEKVKKIATVIQR